jgi:hypothetical protein
VLCAAPTVKQHKPHSRTKNQEPNKAADCPPDAVPLIATHPQGSAERHSKKHAPKESVKKKRKKVETEKPKNGDNPPAEAQPEAHAAGVSSQTNRGRSRKRRKTAEGLVDTSVRERKERAEPLEGGSKLGDVAGLPNGQDLLEDVVTSSERVGRLREPAEVGAGSRAEERNRKRKQRLGRAVKWIYRQWPFLPAKVALRFALTGIGPPRAGRRKRCKPLQAQVTGSFSNQATVFKEMSDGRQGGTSGHFGNQARVFKEMGGSQSEEVAVRKVGQEAPEGPTLGVQGAGTIKRGKLRQGSSSRPLQPTVGNHGAEEQQEAQDGSRGEKSPRSEEGRVAHEIEESVERERISLEAAATRDAFRQLLAGLVGASGRSDATGSGSLPKTNSCPAGGMSTRAGGGFQIEKGAELGGQAAPSSGPSAAAPKRRADRIEENGAKGKKREGRKRGSLGTDFRAQDGKGSHAETASQKQEGLRVLVKADSPDAPFVVRNSEDSQELLNVSESWGAARLLTRLDSGQAAKGGGASKSGPGRASRSVAVKTEEGARRDAPAGERSGGATVGLLHGDADVSIGGGRGSEVRKLVSASSGVSALWAAGRHQNACGLLRIIWIAGPEWGEACPF